MAKSRWVLMLEPNEAAEIAMMLEYEKIRLRRPDRLAAVIAWLRGESQESPFEEEEADRG